MGLIPFRCSWRIWRSKASHTWHHLHPMPWESRAHFTLQTLTVYHCHLMLSVQLFFQLNFIYFKMEKRWFIRGTSHNLLKSTDELTDIFTGSGFIALPQKLQLFCRQQQASPVRAALQCLPHRPIPTHSTSATRSISTLLVQEHPVLSKPNLPATSIHFSYIRGTNKIYFIFK